MPRQSCGHDRRSGRPRSHSKPAITPLSAASNCAGSSSIGEVAGAVHDHGPHAVAAQRLDVRRLVVGVDRDDGDGPSRVERAEDRAVVAQRVGQRVERDAPAAPTPCPRRPTRRGRGPPSAGTCARRIAGSRPGSRGGTVRRTPPAPRPCSPPRASGRCRPRPPRRPGPRAAGPPRRPRRRPSSGRRGSRARGPAGRRPRPRRPRTPASSRPPARCPTRRGRRGRSPRRDGGRRTPPSAPANTCGRTTSRGRRRSPASPRPATSYRSSMPSGEVAAGLSHRKALGPDVLVQAEHVVGIPGPLERDQPVVLGVAVDAPDDRLVAGLGHVVDVAAGDAPRLA